MYIMGEGTRDIIYSYSLDLIGYLRHHEHDSRQWIQLAPTSALLTSKKVKVAAKHGLLDHGLDRT